MNQQGAGVGDGEDAESEQQVDGDVVADKVHRRVIQVENLKDHKHSGEDDI